MSTLTSSVTRSGFDDFLRENKQYSEIYEVLFANSRLLATSAQLVYELHNERLQPVASDILSFVTKEYGSRCIERYLSRVRQLAALQGQFDAHPCVETLGSGEIVDNHDYCLTLLLSIVLTNHRFEIMDALTNFVRSQGPSDRKGRIASIGAGTGYELKLIAEAVSESDWDIEAYDTDERMLTQAKRFLTFFQITNPVRFRSVFPLDAPDPEYAWRYDAIVICEVLEHLIDPITALKTLREYLTDKGHMFVTMAISIAQEDHVFWYPDINSCREQLRECGLKIEYEWLAPQTVRFPPPDRERGFKRGNYIATVTR